MLGMRNGSTVHAVTLLLSLVAALAGLWNGWQIGGLTSQLNRLTGQVQTLQELLVTHVTTPGVHRNQRPETPRWLGVSAHPPHSTTLRLRTPLRCVLRRKLLVLRHV